MRSACRMRHGGGAPRRHGYACAHAEIRSPWRRYCLKLRIFVRQAGVGSAASESVSVPYGNDRQTGQRQLQPSASRRSRSLAWLVSSSDRREAVALEFGGSMGTLRRLALRAAGRAGCGRSGPDFLLKRERRAARQAPSSRPVVRGTGTGDWASTAELVSAGLVRAWGEPRRSRRASHRSARLHVRMRE